HSVRPFGNPRNVCNYPLSLPLQGMGTSLPPVVCLLADVPTVKAVPGELGAFKRPGAQQRRTRRAIIEQFHSLGGPCAAPGRLRSYLSWLKGRAFASS